MIEKKVSLKKYCSYGTGGKAELFSAPKDLFDLKVALKIAADNSLPVTLLGTGCNVLISDKGVNGLVICTRDLMTECEFAESEVYAGAGLMLDELISQSIDRGLAGIENMSGIPGTVGGAVVMNAGAFGTEIKDAAVSVDVCGYDGVVQSINAADAGFGYRRADNLHGIVLGARFRLEKGDRAELEARRAEILTRRSDKQPLDCLSCGSVFKRPEGNFAGALIERCGLKGFTIGGAQVSEKHANFIINTGRATSADIYALIKHVQETVFKETGVALEREVRFIGF